LPTEVTFTTRNWSAPDGSKVVPSFRAVRELGGRRGIGPGRERLNNRFTPRGTVSVWRGGAGGPRRLFWVGTRATRLAVIGWSRNASRLAATFQGRAGGFGAGGGQNNVGWLTGPGGPATLLGRGAPHRTWEGTSRSRILLGLPWFVGSYAPHRLHGRPAAWHGRSYCRRPGK